MLKLCICDDCTTEVNKIKDLIKLSWKEHQDLSIQVTSFSSAFDLLDHIETNGGFDLYLLDIIMPCMSGMELARCIRKRMEKAEILFLTTSREYAVEAFGVEATGYLLKPIRQDAFNQALHSCIKKLKPKENPSLLLKTKEGIRKVHIHELLSVESIRHSYRCTLIDGTTLEVSGTISSFYEQLKSYACFYMPHRAFIINFDYVCGLMTTTILMENGKEIPVSRNSYIALKNTYMDYMLQRNKK